MKEYQFTLKFKLPDSKQNPADHEDALFEAGCDDALMGTGIDGRIALDFSREAENAEDAVLSALAAVYRAIPDAKLIEATPDLVGLSDIATLLKISRQAMRKMMLVNSDRFPLPVHEGKQILWHMSKIVAFLQSTARYELSSEIGEVAEVNRTLNTVIQTKDINRNTEARFREILQA